MNLSKQQQKVSKSLSKPVIEKVKKKKNKKGKKKEKKKNYTQINGGESQLNLHVVQSGEGNWRALKLCVTQP